MPMVNEMNRFCEIFFSRHIVPLPEVVIGLSFRIYFVLMALAVEGRLMAYLVLYKRAKALKEAED